MVVDAIFHREAYRKFVLIWQELRKARRDLARISAQDDFAKWARQQRLIDRLQADYDQLSKIYFDLADELEGERRTSVMKRQFLTSLIVRIVTYVATMWVLIWRMAGVSVLTMPSDLLGPFGKILCLPKLAHGQISAVVLYSLVTASIKRICS